VFGFTAGFMFSLVVLSFVVRSYFVFQTAHFLFDSSSPSACVRAGSLYPERFSVANQWDFVGHPFLIPTWQSKEKAERQPTKATMPPKKKDEKKPDEVREEIGVFVFADGTRYDGQYLRRVLGDMPAASGQPTASAVQTSRSVVAAAAAPSNVGISGGNSTCSTPNPHGPRDGSVGGVSTEDGAASSDPASNAPLPAAAAGGKPPAAPGGAASALQTQQPASVPALSTDAVNADPYVVLMTTGQLPTTVPVQGASTTAAGPATPAVAVTEFQRKAAAGTLWGGVAVHGGSPVYRHGNGVYWDHGSMYDGQWHLDQMHGHGTFTLDTGAKYTGAFFASQFCGEGIYVWPDGTRYDGEWRANVMHGEGTYTDVNGRRWRGRWYNGVGTGLLEVLA
jgi:hypothetical protein